MTADVHWWCKLFDGWITTDAGSGFGDGLDGRRGDGKGHGRNYGRGRGSGSFYDGDGPGPNYDGNGVGGGNYNPEGAGRRTYGQ